MSPPILQPTVPTDPSLPDLLETTWDADEVASYFAELEARAAVSAVIVKGAAEVQSKVTALDLTAAKAALGSSFGVQIRYVLDGEELWDTLMPGPAGVRVVRIQH